MQRWRIWDWLHAGLVKLVAFSASTLAGERPVSPEEALAMFSVDEGFVVELVAAEPLTQDPVAIDWGFDGKLWVAEMADYPYGMDGAGKPGGRVRFLTDGDGDGRMDDSTLFLDGLSFPTSVMAWGNGVLVAAAPDILYAEDTDGDGRADRREVLFTGFMEGNQQLRLNGLRWGLDGWIYAASGGHHAGFGADNRVRVGPRQDAPEVALGSGDLRFRPGPWTIERIEGPSQFGRVRDDWGHWFGVQNSYPLWHYVLEEAALKRNPRVVMRDPRNQLRGQQPRVYGAKPTQKRFHGFDHVGRYTSACGPSIYRDDWLFPHVEKRTHAFTCEPFSNLVQHHHLHRSGVSFEGSRAPTTSKTDFLASADRWCRPVMTRTGPDGALWVVDMYRYMIEHPDWLPQNGRDELKPFYRHGEDRGRIYRVVRKGKERKRIPKLVDLGPAALVDHLADSNGLVRDAAQRLIVHGRADRSEEWLRDPSWVPSLKRLCEDGESPRVRLQAVATLAALGLADEAIVRTARRDRHPGVRRLAVGLASGTSDGIAEMADDPDPAVRLAVAVALGDDDRDRSGEALLALAKQRQTDPFTQAAILSSVPKHYDVFARSAFALRHQETIVRGLLSMAPFYPDQRSTLLQRLFQQENPSDLDFRLLAHWLDSSKREKTDPDWTRIMSEARERADDSGASEKERRSALLLLGRHRPGWADEFPVLVRCLTPQVPNEVQLAAVDALIRSRRDAVPEMVLERWPSLSPTVRRAVLDGLIAYQPWRERVLRFLEGGLMRPRDFSVTQQQRLSRLAPEAATWLGVPQNREKALKARSGSLELAGNVKTGREHFAARCALCHQVGDLGKPIGPDLRALTNRSKAAVFAAILDPNRAVEPLYLAYTATTVRGEVVYGTLVSETGNTLTFQQLSGTERQLLRADLESLVSSQASLMPEGLEAGLSDQELADLIAFVQSIR